MSGRLAYVQADIVAMRREGHTLQAIGDRFGCSREAIRLVCAESSVKPPPPLGAYRRLARAVAVAARLTMRDDNGGSLSLHGSRSRYLAGCRCADCTEAQRLYQRTLVGREPPKHGTVSAYLNYRCRCELCIRAGSENNHYWHSLRFARGTHER